MSSPEEVFSYVSSLSPIKPINARNVPPVYGDLTIPQPTPVFRSPQSAPVTRPLCSELPDTEKFTPSCVGKVLSESAVGHVPPVSEPMAQSICSVEKEVPFQIRPCSSSGSVNEFFVPVKESGNSSGSSVFRKAPELPKNLPDDDTVSKETGKECQEDATVQSPSYNSSGYAEGFLTNPMEPIRSTSSPDSIIKHSGHSLQSLQNDLSTAKEDSVKRGPTTEFVEIVNSLYQPGYPVQTENNIKKDDRAKESHELSYTENPIPVSQNAVDNIYADSSPSPGMQCHESSVQQIARDNFTVLSTDEASQALECQKEKPTYSPDKNQNGGFSSISNTSTEDGGKIQSIRKLLQFEATETSRMSNQSSENTLNDTFLLSNLESPTDSLISATLNASQPETFATSSDKQFSRPTNIPGQTLPRISSVSYKMLDRSGQNSESTPITAPRRSGIGLHLNSIVKSVPMNSTGNIQLVEKGCVIAQEDKLLTGAQCQMQEDSKPALDSSISLGNLPVKSTVISDSPFFLPEVESREQSEQPSELITLNSMSSHQSPLIVNPLNKCSNLSDRKRSSDDIGRSEGPNQMSPRKKRKKAAENEGCKRCNCKRTKCLKLYCDCFAAGLYCAEACACQGCQNRPEFEDTVLETRQEIESRNPLAFAPKVVQAESPRFSGDDNKHKSPAPRHKRGCNCKKSKCLKKYCECYQVGVGCSFGCRCEGCKNIYGKKTGSIEVMETAHINPKDEQTRDNRSCGTEADARKEIPDHDQYIRQFSPLTPSLDGSSGTDAFVSHLSKRRYFQSPDSGISVLSSSGKLSWSSGDSVDSNKFLRVHKASIALRSYNQNWEDPNGSKDASSLRWDGFGDVYDFSPLPNPSSNAMSSSVDSDIESKSIMQQGSNCLSVGCPRWHSSPITPMPMVGETKVVFDPDSESGLLNFHEDDTPEILKDTNSPVKGVKVSSPNKKRVSPPHKHLHEMRSISSPGGKSGRKYILRSLPSFPPLTPIIRKGHD